MISGKKMAPCACTEMKCLISILNLLWANGVLWLFEITNTYFPTIHVLFCLFPNATLPILLLSYTFKPLFCPLIQILSFLEVKSGCLSLEPDGFCCIINIYHNSFNTNSCAPFPCRAGFIKGQGLCSSSQFPQDFRVFPFGPPQAGPNTPPGWLFLLNEE